MFKKSKKEILDYIIIGAGPIGIETAVILKDFNHKILILEKGDKVGYSVERNSHLDMFSPWYYNYSPYGIDILQKNGRFKEPKNEYESTLEYLKNYLLPLIETSQVDIKLNCEVINIGKVQLAKNDLIGENRKKFPFKISVKIEDKEEFLYAWNVIDSSGVYDTPLNLGEGRIPAINELKYKDEIIYQAIDRKKPELFDGKRVLVLGQTCCTAKSLNELKKYLKNKDTKIIYLNETGLKPYINQLKNDIFHRRVENINLANKLLNNKNDQIEIYEKHSINKIDKIDGVFQIELNDYLDNEIKTIEVDTIISNFGFNSDNSIYSQLQIHECYASLSPMNYAASMLADTLDHRFTQTSQTYKNILNPETNFYIIGSKSYGRNIGFSIFIGIGQIVELLSKKLEIQKEQLLLKDGGILEQKLITYIQNEDDKLSTKSNPMPQKVKGSQEDKYKIITENLQEVVFQTDLKQKITYLSPSWEKLTGFKVKDYIGLDWQTLLHEDSRAQGVCQCNAFMSNELEDYNEEFKILCKDGTVKWVNVNASVLVDKNDIAYGTIGSMLDITRIMVIRKQLEEKNEKLDKLAITDELTSLYNRRYFNKSFYQEFDRAVRSNQRFNIILCDIDYFKAYNDTYGHLKGDYVLEEISKVLKSNFNRKIDIVARYGGEEFVIILPSIESEDVFNLVAKAKDEIENLKIVHEKSKTSTYVTMSFGLVTGYLSENDKPEKLLALVDKQLYHSKDAGRNTITAYEM